MKSVPGERIEPRCVCLPERDVAFPTCLRVYIFVYTSSFHKQGAGSRPGRSHSDERESGALLALSTSPRDGRL